jgi:hypothetical protein
MTSLERAISAIDGSMNGADDAQSLVAAKCRALMRGYAVRWAESPYVVDTVEEVVVSDLWNPETSRKSRSFMIAGKLDLKAWCGTRRVLIDHKTTSEDISDPNSPYWRQLVIEGQPTHYMLLEHLNGRKIDDAVWDVIRKPTISPKQVTKSDQSSVFTSGQYFGCTLSQASMEELRHTGRESLEMYEARLAWDCTEIRPEWYFQRRSVPRLDSEIHEWATELWGHSQDLLHARRENRWPRNAGACMNFGRPCVYLGICSGHDSPETDNWRTKAQVHNELPLDGDGRDVLTNSRIKCFQTCRRKHFYQYEWGIEPNRDDEPEALYFGSLLHKALEAYFIDSKGVTIDSDTASVPESDTGIASDETPVYF